MTASHPTYHMRRIRLERARAKGHPQGGLGYRIHTSCSPFMAFTPRFAAWNWNQPLSITMGPGLP